MADPARASAADPGPDSAEPRRPDPLSPGWVNVRAMAIAMAEEAAASAADLTERPDCPRALRRADRICEQLTELNAIARRCVMDESILAEREEAAYNRGVADCKAARCHLEAVPDPG